MDRVRPWAHGQGEALFNCLKIFCHVSVGFGHKIQQGQWLSKILRPNMPSYLRSKVKFQNFDNKSHKKPTWKDEKSKKSPESL